MAGKQDWLAHGLPSEGEEADEATAIDISKDDVVTCGLGDSVQDVRKRVEGSPYPFALVLSETGVLLGRLRASILRDCGDVAAEDVMEAGPSTVRPDVVIAALVERLRKRDFKYGIVTLPEGRLLGVVRRSDAEQRLTD